MTKNDVILLLKEYNSNKAIIELNESDRTDLIEELCLRSFELSDMPRSITNKIHSIVEETAISLDETFAIRNNEVNQYLEILRAKNELLDRVFGPLSKRQKFILQRLYMQDYTYFELQEDYKREFNLNYISRNQLKNIANAGLERMIVIAQNFIKSKA